MIVSQSEIGQKMIEWNITRLMAKFEDREMKVKQKQTMKDLGKKIFEDDSTNAFIDVCKIHAPFNYCCHGTDIYCDL